MSRNHLWAWVGVVCLLCAGAVYAQQDRTASDGNAANSSAVAAVPRLIKYSGEVKDARGEPVTSAAVRLTFGVYEEQQGGAALWVESQMVQLDEQGHYTLLLGATRADGLPVELFPAGKPRWLGVQVEGRDEDPRVLLVSVPYALKAEDAAMLGGRSASDFVLAEQLREEVRTQVEAQKPGIATQAVEMLVNNPPNVPAITEGPSTFTCATTGDCVAVTQSSTGRALRATATSASEAALLQQNGTGYGLRVLSQSNYAIYGVVQGTVMGTTYGVRGLVNSTTGAGILGSNQATTGVAYGLMGQTSSVSGIGLYGRALATTGTTVGLTGDADSTSGRGIMGRATATSGTTMGIYAEARSASGTALVVNNTASGKLLSGQANGVEKLSVDGSGNVRANAYLDLAGNPIGGGGGTVTSVGSGTGLTGGPITTIGTLSLDTAFTDGRYARLGNPNTFAADQTVPNLTATGNVSGATGVFSGSNATQIVSVTQTGSGTALVAAGGTLGMYGSGSTYGVLGSGSSYGVYGSGAAGVEGSGSSYGVYGSSSNYGVYGTGSVYGVYGTGISFGVYSDGNFGASGSKSAVVALPDDRVVSLYAIESPENWFEDFGSATLREGVAGVTLDPTFALTINTQMEYHVFLTPKGDCEGLYVTNETPAGFEVRELRGGKSNVAFDYRIVARRRGFESVRMQEVEADAETVGSIREHNHARPGQPKLRLPKKPEVPPAPSGAATAQTPPRINGGANN